MGDLQRQMMTKKEKQAEQAKVEELLWEKYCPGCRSKLVAMPRTLCESCVMKTV